MIQRRAIVVLSVLVVGLAGCRKSDAERAAEERAAIEKEMRSSYALTPYRLFKLLARSQGDPAAPPELQRFAAETEGVLRRVEQGATIGADEVLALGALMVRARGVLDRHDEDQYPVLYPRMVGEPPPAWYDNGTEHLFLSAFDLLSQVTGTQLQQSLPMMTFAAYELSRAEPKPSWPSGVRAVARFERGVFYCLKEKHFAADEELTRYLAELDEPAAALLLGGAPGDLDRLRVLRAVGLLARGWNRLKLDREKQGLQDLDDGLRALQEAGVENELTLWAWAFVHGKRNHPQEAARALEKLAESPHLDEGARRDIRQAATAMAAGGPAPEMLAQGRAVFLVTRALVARLGGVERILAALIGHERAHRVTAPVTALTALQARLAEASDPAALAGEAGAAGKALVEGLRAKVQAKPVDLQPAKDAP